MLSEFDHQTVPVSQLEKSIIWYHKIFGYDLITYTPQKTAILTIDGNQFIKLVSKTDNSNHQLSVLMIPDLTQKYETISGYKDIIIDIDLPDIGVCYLLKDIDKNNLLLFPKR
jgi:catechol 2,3-dioxygenase-like lactoylglutathione lyase family enzyme